MAPLQPQGFVRAVGPVLSLRLAGNVQELDRAAAKMVRSLFVMFLQARGAASPCPLLHSRRRPAPAPTRTYLCSQRRRSMLVASSVVLGTSSTFEHSSTVSSGGASSAGELAQPGPTSRHSINSSLSPHLNTEAMLQVGVRVEPCAWPAALPPLAALPHARSGSGGTRPTQQGQELDAILPLVSGPPSADDAGKHAEGLACELGRLCILQPAADCGREDWERRLWHRPEGDLAQGALCGQGTWIIPPGPGQAAEALGGGVCSGSARCPCPPAHDQQRCIAIVLQRLPLRHLKGCVPSSAPFRS